MAVLKVEAPGTPGSTCTSGFGRGAPGVNTGEGGVTVAGPICTGSGFTGFLRLGQVDGCHPRNLEFAELGLAAGATSVAAHTDAIISIWIFMVITGYPSPLVEVLLRHGDRA